MRVRLRSVDDQLQLDGRCCHTFLSTTSAIDCARASFIFATRCVYLQQSKRLLFAASRTSIRWRRLRKQCVRHRGRWWGRVCWKNLSWLEWWHGLVRVWFSWKSSWGHVVSTLVPVRHAHFRFRFGTAVQLVRRWVIPSAGDHVTRPHRVELAIEVIVSRLIYAYLRCEVNSWRWRHWRLWWEQLTSGCWTVSATTSIVIISIVQRIYLVLIQHKWSCSKMQIIYIMKSCIKCNKRGIVKRYTNAIMVDYGSISMSRFKRSLKCTAFASCCNLAGRKRFNIYCRGWRENFCYLTECLHVS